MSSNNNEANGMAVAFAFIGVTFMFTGIIIYAVLAFTTVALTIFCAFTLWKPRKLFGEVVTPKEARWFIYRGIIGWFALPLLVSLIVQVMKWRIDADWMIHVMIAGYIIGALGGEFIIAKMKEAEAKPETIDVAPNVTQQPVIEKPKQAFEFATWDDEEPR